MPARHVVRLHREDIDHRVLSYRCPRPCREAARPYASWVRQVETNVGDIDVTGPASAWGMVTGGDGVPSQCGCGDALLWRMPPRMILLQFSIDEYFIHPLGQLVPLGLATL